MNKMLHISNTEHKTLCGRSLTSILSNEKEGFVSLKNIAFLSIPARWPLNVTYTLCQGCGKFYPLLLLTEL